MEGTARAFAPGGCFPIPRVAEELLELYNAYPSPPETPACRGWATPGDTGAARSARSLRKSSERRTRSGRQQQVSPDFARAVSAFRSDSPLPSRAPGVTPPSLVELFEHSSCGHIDHRSPNSTGDEAESQADRSFAHQRVERALLGHRERTNHLRAAEVSWRGVGRARAPPVPLLASTLSKCGPLLEGPCGGR